MALKNEFGDECLTSAMSFKISGKLKAQIKEVKKYLVLLTNPLAVEKEHDDIYAVRSDDGEVIPGVLRYGKSCAGSDVAVLCGIHMNEMSGVFAAWEFHNRWIGGAMPEEGCVFVASGNVDRALEFVNFVLNSDEISKEKWVSFSVTENNFNYNRIPEKETDDLDEGRAREIIKCVLNQVKGRVIDIHNTASDAPPIATFFMDKDETPEECKSRIDSAGIVKNLPIENFIVWKPGPFNGMESLRQLGSKNAGALPLLVETGGGSDFESFNRADLYLQFWLDAVANIRSKICPKKYGKQHYYFETDAFYHPAVRPSDYSYLDSPDFLEAKEDTLVLIRGSSVNDIEGWSHKAKRALRELDSGLVESRLDNFVFIEKGEVIAIGIRSGLVIRAPRDGFVLMACASPFIKPTFNETFANLSIRV